MGEKLPPCSPTIIIDRTLTMCASACGRNFWETVEAFSVEQQKQLLAFVTGSDRIPLGGLAKVKFIIVKNGPDSDRSATGAGVAVQASL